MSFVTTFLLTLLLSVAVHGLVLFSFDVGTSSPKLHWQQGKQAQVSVKILKPMQNPKPKPKPNLMPMPKMEEENKEESVKDVGTEQKEAYAKSNIIPEYPWKSRRKGEEGKVVLEVTIDPEGRPQNITVINSSGFSRLDAAAEKAVLQGSFVPANKNGSPVESKTTLSFHFKITD